MKCPVCLDEIKAFDAPKKSHLLIHKSTDGHVHVHGDLSEKENMKELIDAAVEETGVPLLKQGKDIPKEIVFHNRQRIGDMLMFTCGIRDFKIAYPQIRVNVISTAGHIFDNNPHVDRTLLPTDQNTIKIGPGKLTNSSNRIDWHFANAFRVSIEDALGISIPQGESRPDIWLTKEEYDAPRLWPQPYWIISLNGEKGWGCKMYPFEKWQEFVAQNPDITFVQIGTNEDNPPRLKGANVIDHVGKTQDGKTGIRELFKLFLNAEGSISLVSFAMHLSGALNKPALVVAGAREPVSFTRYPGHQYLSTDGCLPCGVNACWHCDINTCTNLIRGKELVPRCVDMITPEDLTRALARYYVGGRLKKDVPSDKPKLKNVVTGKKSVQEVKNTDIVEPSKDLQGKPGIVEPSGKFIKIVSTARGWGGCARSVTTIIKFLLAAGHRVEFIPFRNKVSSSEFKAYIASSLPGLKVTESYDTVSEKCDVFFMYADDYIWEFEKPEIADVFANINAESKIMMLNYRQGGVGRIPWTQGWDKYMFLNSDQEKELLAVLPGVKTKVLPPCTELSIFLKCQPDFSGSLRVVRHSSQGDTKFDKDFGKEVNGILKRENSEVHLLPGPSFVASTPDNRVRKYSRTADPSVIASFLSKGNLFWYSLPKGYMDMGPRVILEAMAAGLPVIADAWGGAVDRVPRETGWLCYSKDEMINIMQNVTSGELKQKGEAARDRALTEFVPEKWIQEILQ